MELKVLHKNIIHLFLDFRFYLLVLIILITALIFKDLKHDYNIVDTNPILVVESDEQNCYTKNEWSPTWNQLFKNDLITTSSRIETLLNSSLHLNFLNFNGFLNLSENTAVELNQSKNEIVIDFKRGELFAAYHIQHDKVPLKIRFKNNSILVNNSDLFLRQDKQGALILSINYGEVELVRDDQKIILKSGDILKVVSNSQYFISQPEIKLLTPLHQDHYILVDKDTTKVRVAWKAPATAQYQILLGNNISELKPVNKVQKTKKHEAFLNLTEGTYYLKVESLNQNKKMNSDIVKLFIERQVPVQPLLPAQDHVITKMKDEIEVKFQWENPSQFEKLFLEISHNAQFSDLIFHETIGFGNYFLINIKKPGTYFWRVNGFPKKSSNLVLGDSRKLTIE